MRLLVKARKPPAGQMAMFGPSGQPTARPKMAWQPIPGGKHGGQRRRKGTGWEYRYPKPGGGFQSAPPKEEPPKIVVKPDVAIEVRRTQQGWVAVQGARIVHRGTEAEVRSFAAGKRPAAPKLAEPSGKPPEPEPKLTVKPEAEPKDVVLVPVKKTTGYQYEDVGVHVPGAHKDIAAMSRDELERDSKQAFKLINKSNVFGRYTDEVAQKDREAGVSPEVAWWKRELLDAITNRPPNSADSRDKYRDAAKILHESFARFKTEDDVMTFIKEWQDSLHEALWEPTDDKELIRKVQALRSMAYSDRQVAQKELKDQYGIQDVRHRGERFEIRRPPTEAGKARASDSRLMLGALGKKFAGLLNVEMKHQNRYDKDGDITGILFTYRPIPLDIPTRPFKEAKKRLDVQVTGADDRWAWTETKPGKRRKTGATKTKGSRLTWHREIGVTERKGLPEVVPGTERDLSKAFGIRAVQYGASATQVDRQWHVEACHAGLKDLAQLVGVSESKISLNGRLAVAFGARGRGGALAHYEPMEMIINLTKSKGAGSLAHEWGHFLDHIISASYNPERRRPGYLSEAKGQARGRSGSPPAIANAMAAVLDVIKTRELSEDDAAAGRKKRMELSTKMSETLGRVRGLQGRLVTEKVGDRREYKHNDDYREYTAALNDHNALVDEYNATPAGRRADTEYFALAKQSGGKWATDRELFARAFESYVESKMEDKDQRSSYLVSGTLKAHPGAYLEHGSIHRNKVNEVVGRLLRVLHEHDQFSKSAASLWLDSLLEGPRLVVDA